MELPGIHQRWHRLVGHGAGPERYDRAFCACAGTRLSGLLRTHVPRSLGGLEMDLVTTAYRRGTLVQRWRVVAGAYTFGHLVQDAARFPATSYVCTHADTVLR